MTCPACGAEAPDGARFCAACGQYLQVRADERRVVTVLFADLVGFTTLSELRDPEQVKNLVDRCFERLVADVKAYGGRVDKIVGDAIVALFGAPVAHEDDAERAVRAALQMQRTLATTTADLGAEVQLRIGVNTGEVLVGALRAGGDYTAMGDVVNVASRLQTLARPGQVVAGAATHAATREAVQYEFLGDVQARGRESPVEAWQALEVLALPGHRPRRASGPLIGREEELGILRHTLAAAVTRRRGHLVLLLGEAGIGKSRLTEELVAVARAERSVLVLEGRCVPYGEANLWWPVAEALRQACGIDPADPADLSAQKCRAAVAQATALDADSTEVSRITAGLLHLMGDEDALPAVDPARAAEEARRAVLAMLEALARSAPLMLVLAELHWADPGVLDLVDQVLDRLRALPVLFVATARSELEERWLPKPGRHNLVVMNLDPLDRTASQQLLTTLLGDTPSTDLRDMLLERSGGNPFFLEELVALLTEAGVLRHEGSQYHLDHDLAAMELPATLRGLVAARIDALPVRERSALEDAAILGHAGPVTALAALAMSRQERDIASVLEGLAAKDLLTIVDGEAEFRSELVREVAYDTLTKAERARRHAALAEWLAQTARSTNREDEYLEQLAHHYGAAAELVQEMGDVEGVRPDICDLALHSIERAAVRSFQRDQHQVAVGLLDHALRLLPPAKDKSVRRVLLARAEAKTQLHDLPGARADLDRVMAEVGDGDDHPRSLARALRVRGMIEQHEGDLGASAVSLDQAVEVYRSLGDVRGEAETMRHRGMTSLFAGDREGADRAIKDALKVFRETGSRRDEAWALWNLAWISFSRGDMKLSEERLAKSARAFTDAGDFGGVGWAYGLLGFVRLFEGRRAEALELAERILTESRERGDRWAQGMMQVLISGVRLWDGDTAAAVEPAREAVRIFKDVGDVTFAIEMAAGMLCRALMALGRVEESYAALDEAMELADAKRPAFMAFSIANLAGHIGDAERARAAIEPVRDDPFIEGDSGRADGEVMVGLANLQLGDVRTAVEGLETAVAASAPGGGRANALATLALARAAAGDGAGAIAAGDETVAMAGATYLDRMLGTIGRAFGLLQAGRTDEAWQSFRDAIAIVDRTGDVVHQATARLAFGRALETISAHDAAEVLGDAHERLHVIGITATGWDTAFGLAASAAAPAERTSAG